MPPLAPPPAGAHVQSHSPSSGFNELKRNLILLHAARIIRVTNCLNATHIFAAKLLRAASQIIYVENRVSRKSLRLFHNLDIMWLGIIILCMVRTM